MAEHTSPIKTWQQLVVVVAAAFIVPAVVIALIAGLVTSGRRGLSAEESEVLARIQPVGTVQLATATGPRTPMSAEEVYTKVCKTCHDTGVAGAPKLGDKTAWSKIVKQGEKLTLEHAINGIRGMPPKGGNPDLSDAEMHAAVVHMANAAGAKWKAPAAPAAPAAQPVQAAERSGADVVKAACAKCHETGQGGAPKIGDRTAWIQRAKRGLDQVYASALKGHAKMPARGGMAELSDVEVKRAVEFMLNSGTAAQVTSAAAPAAAAAAPPAAAADGKKVYDTACFACHATGAAGAPKLGDKSAWAPRLASGTTALYQSSLKGKGAMPPKGGNAALSDAEVKAAVDYMTASVK
jgi:cytochrome c5